APHERDNAFVFVGFETVAFQDFRIDHADSRRAGLSGPLNILVLIDCTADSRITSPSVLPSGDSHARSGCGISPTTLRASLQRPAMPLIDPFGLASSVTSPAGVTYRKITCRLASSFARTSGEAK